MADHLRQGTKVKAEIKGVWREGRVEELLGDGRVVIAYRITYGTGEMRRDEGRWTVPRDAVERR